MGQFMFIVTTINLIICGVCWMKYLESEVLEMIKMRQVLEGN